MNSDTQETQIRTLKELSLNIDQLILTASGEIEQSRLALGNVLLRERIEEAGEDKVNRAREALRQAEMNLLDLEAMQPIIPSHLSAMISKRQIALLPKQQAETQAKYERQKQDFEENHPQMIDDVELGETAMRLFDLAKEVGEEKEMNEYFNKLSCKGGNYNVLKRYKVRV